MRSIHLKGFKSLFIGCLVAFFLCSSVFMVPLNKALALSPEELTAKLIEGAKKEGKLLWYTSMTSVQANKLLSKFNKKYPFIKTEIYRSSGEKMLARIMSEARAKRYKHDLTMLSGLRSGHIMKRGLAAKYLSPERKFYSENFKDKDGYWTATYVNFIVMGYNTKLVSPQEAPKTWSDLLDSKWKGRMGIATNSEYWFIVMLKIMGEEKGLEFMKKLSEQNLAWRSGTTLNTQLLAAGEFSIAVKQFNQRVEEYKSKGAPVEWVAPEPVIPQYNVISVAEHAPHPNAARLFVDFILSKEGMKMIASFYRIPAREDVDPIVPRLKCKGLEAHPVDDASITRDYARYEKLFREVLMKQ